MTPDESAMCLDVLHAAFPNVIISRETVLVYARFLADIPLDKGAEIVAQWIAFDGKKWPSISELRTLAFPMIDADEAFREVRTKVGTVGRYRTPTWSHPAIADAVNAIGWREICDEEHAPSLRKHFTTAYDATKRRYQSAESRSLIAGIVKELPQRALEGAARKKLAP